ncbi:MAG TPA: host attachment protein [Crinalium sp.]|jgi:protein required for attachment to host cells
MNPYLVAVINAVQARLLTLDATDVPEHEAGPTLIEQTKLENATQDRQGQNLWSSVKAGRNRGSGGQAHSYDDHRQNHMHEFERRFAQEIAAQIASLIQTQSPQQLLLIAEPQILGLMRDALASLIPKTIKVSELGKDLCQLKPSELHTYLADKKLLPAYKRAFRSI